MSATVGAALKKIAVALLSDPKVIKTVLGIVLGIIIIIVLPFASILAIFNGDIEIDTNRLQEIVVENLSAEEKSRLQFVENTMYGIQDKMTAAGFDSQRVTEAQVLYVLALSDYSHDSGFIDKLVAALRKDSQTRSSLRR